MKAIQHQGVIGTVSSRRDKSIRYSVETPELKTSEKALFMDYQGVVVEMLIKPVDFVAKEVERVETEIYGKTPSQRLRAVLFVKWDQEGRLGEFRDYYIKRMEQYIEHEKSKLEDL